MAENCLIFCSFLQVFSLKDRRKETSYSSHGFLLIPTGLLSEGQAQRDILFLPCFVFSFLGPFTPTLGVLANSLKSHRQYSYVRAFSAD